MPRFPITLCGFITVFVPACMFSLEFRLSIMFAGYVSPAAFCLVVDDRPESFVTGLLSHFGPGISMSISCGFYSALFHFGVRLSSRQYYLNSSNWTARARSSSMALA